MSDNICPFHNDHENRIKALEEDRKNRVKTDNDDIEFKAIVKIKLEEIFKQNTGLAGEIQKINDSRQEEKDEPLKIMKSVKLAIILGIVSLMLSTGVSVVGVIASFAAKRLGG